MCKASVHANATRKAVAGETLGIGVMSLFGLGAFHAPNQSVEACVVCVENGAELMLTGISTKVRELYQLDDTEEALFVETEGSHSYVIHDLVLLRGHPDLGALPLSYFNGASAKLKTVEGTDDIVESIMRMALAPQLVRSTPTLDDAYRTRQLEAAR